MRTIRIEFDPEIAQRAGFGAGMRMILSTGGFRPSLTLWGFRFGLENERRPGPDNANAPHNFPNSRPVNASTSRVIVVGVLTPAPDNDNAPEASYAPVFSLASNTIRPPFRS